MGDNMKVTISKPPSEKALKNCIKVLLDIIEKNNLYDKYLPLKVSK